MSSDDEVLTDTDEVEIRVRKRPRFPFWRDQKAFGNHGPRADTSLRLLIVALAIATVVVGVAILYINSAVNQVHQTQKDGHASRLKDQAILQKEISQLKGLEAQNHVDARDLACSVVIYLQHQPGADRAKKFIKFLSDRYRCVGYKPGKIPFPKTLPTLVPPPSTTPTPEPVSSDHALPPPVSHSTSVRTSAQASPTSIRVPQPSRTVRPSPTPTSSRPVVPTPTRSTSPPRPTPPVSPSPTSVLCQVLNPLLGTCLLP